jgi:DNA-binding NarL/FixJ family response regulator
MHIRVLVADDFPLVRDGVAQALDRDPGIDVVGKASNGEEALKLAHELKPDVMVLDLHMPELGGIGVLQRLRQELPDVRALALTASESPESLLGAISSGAQGYLTKLTGAEELRQAVITIHGDGSVVEPRLARHLLREYAGGATPGDASSMRPVLTQRESEILRLVARGHTDNEIGAQLYLSPRTVQNHLTRIREKTGLRRRSELTRWAVEHALT